MTTARQAAVKIIEVFNRHWKAFRLELKDIPELQECDKERKRLAWTMAKGEISKKVYSLGVKK